LREIDRQIVLRMPSLCRNTDPLDATLDRLAGDWWIFQLRRGHRYATDDVLIAWSAVEAKPDATSVLDLGSGVGAVGLLTLLRLGAGARLTAIDVQGVSVDLMRRTVEHNGINGRVEVRHGDLRDPEALPETARFDLITANPPFLSPGRASPSPRSQRTTARLELHGDVYDYCRAAARHLAPAARFCFCHRADDPRPRDAIAAAGLALLARRAVVFREGAAPALALYTCGWEGTRWNPVPLLVRDREGERTAIYRAVRRAMWMEESEDPGSPSLT
jgi:tRNA1Val (adenine37-N6)-methyltransferase